MQTKQIITLYFASSGSLNASRNHRGSSRKIAADKDSEATAAVHGPQLTSGLSLVRRSKGAVEDNMRHRSYTTITTSSSTATSSTIISMCRLNTLRGVQEEREKTVGTVAVTDTRIAVTTHRRWPRMSNTAAMVAASQAAAMARTHNLGDGHSDTTTQATIRVVVLCRRCGSITFRDMEVSSSSSSSIDTTRVRMTTSNGSQPNTGDGHERRMIM